MDDTQAAARAELLGLVIRLHDREVDADLVHALRAADPAPLLEGFLAASNDPGAAEAFCTALTELDLSQAALDGLAADYADIYLTHGYRIAPSGSVWLTEEHLERQQPMFEVRAWYDHYGLLVPDWRCRSDDHLVHELQFVQHLLGLGDADALTDAARFLDRHLLPWVPDFCRRVEDRAQTGFHRAAARLTRAALDEVRHWLAQATGIAPEVIGHAFAREQDRARKAAEVKQVARPFVPGLAESW
jgi:TorA maturation chaperone TorD